MIVRALVVAVLLVAISPVFGPVASVSTTTAPYFPPESYWLQAAPDDEDERALHEAATADATAGEKLARLRAVAEETDSTVRALAHLAGALLLLDEGRNGEALAELDADDIADDTKLDDHALLARALAEERLGDFPKAAQAYHAGAALSPAGPRQ